MSSNITPLTQIALTLLAVLKNYIHIVYKKNVLTKHVHGFRVDFQGKLYFSQDRGMYHIKEYARFDTVKKAYNHTVMQ